MNFYELYHIINEYGENLITTLTEKFKKENPTLTPTIIRNYIDRFERIKNNLSEKDITKYSWKELENTVDSNQPKQRIKAGKLDPTVTDANLLYNKDNIRIYLGKDKKSCIKYGNGYTFCISARGEDNMYSHYRIENKGTPYFIFNDNLPKEDNRHLMVLFVYLHGTQQYAKRYSLTLASNRPEDEKEYDKLNKIIKLYPWIKPITNFVDDENKGTVDVDALEALEYYLQESFNAQYIKLYSGSSREPQDTADVIDFLSNENNFLKNFKKLKDFLSDNGKNLISINIMRRFSDPDYGNIVNLKNNKFHSYENIDELTSDLIRMIKDINQNVATEFNFNYKDEKGLIDFIKNNKKIKDFFNSFEQGVERQLSWTDICILKYPDDEKHNILDELGLPYDKFTIKLNHKNYIQEILKKSPVIDSIFELHKEYYSTLNWLKERTPEQLKIISDNMWRFLQQPFQFFRRTYEQML